LCPFRIPEKEACRNPLYQPSCIICQKENNSKKFCQEQTDDRCKQVGSHFFGQKTRACKNKN